ncbi:MAG TPA: hypothetical protein DIU07_08060 [Rhodobacteraceae bacterium]|nr:hypothetical protein [Paracoccaceae bacterium]
MRVRRRLKRRPWWRGERLAVALSLAGCAAAPVVTDGQDTSRPPREIVSGCCNGTGDYPTWAIELADANVELMRQVGLIQLRRGHLEAVPEARALVEAALRPMDVVFVQNRNRVSGQLIPGQFTHGAVYIGTEAQLRAAGLWQLPALVPYREQIAAGASYLEAVDGGVRLTTGDVVLNTDAVVALRPLGMDRITALGRGLDRMGVPFDMRFDANDGSELFCAELIGEIYPAAPLPRTPVPLPGRETILIDRIVAGALTGDLPFGLVGYVKADAGGGAAALSAQDLARDIRAAWP